MSHVNVTINGRQYRMACEAGQETRLLTLAEGFEDRIGSLRGKFGEIGDARLTVMAALMASDELMDANNRISALEQELEAMRGARNASSDRAKLMQSAVANALNAAADRIEKATQVMLKVHREGIGVCGVYPHDIANTKVQQVAAYARRHQHPLQCVMEET